MGNSTCPAMHMPEDPTPFFAGGMDVHFSAHSVGWLIAGCFTLLASAVSFWLILKHLATYTKPAEQRYIVRILFMVPIYSIISWCSYFWWRQALYYQLIRDCYEAVVIASFFYLLLNYLGDTEEEQAAVFRKVEFQHWIWPLGRVRYRPTGSYFLIIMKWSIGQYWVFRPGCTLAAVITEAIDRYCILSWSPRYAHVYLTTIVSISVTIAMYAVLQFYVTMKNQLAHCHPLLKFFCVKAVVFLTFWQSSLLGVLGAVGVIKDSQYWSSLEIQDGISSILSCFEMSIFAFLHCRSFTYKAYVQFDADTGKQIRSLRLSALKDVLDLRDVGRELKVGSKQVAKKMIGRDIEKLPEPDHLSHIFGRSRLETPGEKTRTKEAIASDMQEIDRELERIKKLNGPGDPTADFDALSWARPQDISWMLNNTSSQWQSRYEDVRNEAYDPPLLPPWALIGDARRPPQASTGVIMPIVSPYSAAGASELYENTYPLARGDEVGRSHSWLNRVFGQHRARHSALPQAEEVSEASVQRGCREHHDSDGYSADITTQYLSRQSPRRGPPLPLGGVKTPQALSPSRYPGVDEQRFVDNAYALHEIAQSVSNTPTSIESGVLQRDRVNISSTASPMASNPGSLHRPIHAHFVQPTGAVSSQSSAGIPTSGLHLFRHDLPAVTNHGQSQPQHNIASGASRPASRMHGLGLRLSPQGSES